MEIPYPTASVHIMLVSDQAAANLLPALDPAMRPAEAVLVVTGRMQAKAAVLGQVLSESGIQTTQLQLDNEHDYGSLQTTLMDLATKRQNASIALNVTGGTKLMALAAQSIAEAAGWTVFYVNVDTDEIIWLGERQGERQHINEQLRLRHYLMGYGFDIPANTPPLQTPPAWQNLIQALLLQIGTLEQPIGTLNWLAQQAEDRQSLNIQLTGSQMDSRSLDALLRHFSEADVLSVHGDQLSFSSENARIFAKGGWLEHHVFRTVAAQSHELGIRDKAPNLEVTDQGGVKNELDIAFLARNRLFIVECKTARMDSPRTGKANDTLFKLAEIRQRVGGLGTRSLLASYRSLRESEIKLARALNIELVCGSELADLGNRLRRWVNR